MGGQRGDSKARPGGRLPRVYQGEKILGPLLAAAGSTLAPGEVVARFREAQAAGREPPEVIPSLFAGEPRFASPDTARLLYSNLLGLWERVASGGPIEPAGHSPEPPSERPPSPPPGPVARPLTDDFVEAAWRYLDDLSPREAERLRHRFENAQPELAEYLQFAAGESAAAVETLDALGFEIWAMLELAAFGSRLGQGPSRAVTLRELSQMEGDAPTGEPALERYIADALEEATLDEEEPLPQAEVPLVRRAALAVLRALTPAEPH